MKIKRFTIKGFTLIELLVVISIIGMLASVVLASLSSARDKGKVAAGLTFDTHNYMVLGADATGIWNLNDGAVGASIVSLSDISGNNNVGTFHGSNTYAKGVQGSAAQFNGNTNYISFSTPVRGLPKTANFTMSAWINPTQTCSTGFMCMIVLFGNSTHCNAEVVGMGLYTGSTYLNFYSGCDTVLYSSSKSPISINTWTHVAISVNSSNVIFYVNGKQTDSMSIHSVPYDIKVTSWGSASASASIGGLYDGSQSGTYAFKGAINNVRVYTSSLTAGDIHNIYAEGLPSHQLAAAK